MTAGSGGGRIKTGMHIPAPSEPCTRVGLTVQQVLGVPLRAWGNRSNETAKTSTFGKMGRGAYRGSADRALAGFLPE